MNIQEVADVMEQSFRVDKGLTSWFPIPGKTRFEVDPDDDPCSDIREKIPAMASAVALRTEWRGGEHWSCFGGSPSPIALEEMIALRCSKKTSILVLGPEHWKLMNATTIATLFSQAQAKDRCAIVAIPRTADEYRYWFEFVRLMTD